MPDGAAMAVLRERDIHAVAAVVEGLQFMLQDAKKGDEGAKVTLAALSKALAEASDYNSPLTVIRD